MAKVFTSGDVASHNKPGDLYIVVDGDVYDVTKFQDDHPGMFLSPNLPICSCAHGRQKFICEHVY